ncbi:hypothetical protein [Actinomadura bangladeshensis]|uniref:Uncharacterized protein n=1 Tax=Actinomadura bangladeshensis TaxID=453573 RepID=A0A4R4PA93_9ACTN|nr:hypothetical protein [Actinomadura bangladeshensis]TDC19265.1 hypothetical protein E1284_04085 [Actinomadura bangladeshensis]
MAWQLRIHMIDVGHGDSTLITAVDTASKASRSLLIDAGDVDDTNYSPAERPAQRTESSDRVHRYVSSALKNAGGIPLDHIVVTNYDPERYRGMLGLLRADNLHRLTITMGAVAAEEVAQGANKAEQLAGAAAGARAVSLGAYDLPGGPPGAAAAATTIAGYARQAVANYPGPMTEQAFGVWVAESQLAPAAVNAPVSIPPWWAAEIAEAAAFKAWFEMDDIGYPNGSPPPDVLGRIRATVQERTNQLLRRYMPFGARFDTGGLYARTHVIDIGPEGNLDGNRAALVEDAAAGNIIPTSLGTTAGPGRALTRPPALGSEILWNSGPRAMKAPAGAPQVFVMAEGRRLWQRSGGSIGLPPWQQGQPADVSRTEQESIALLVRFGDYLHLDSGDLPSRGAELIATAVTQPAPGPVAEEPFPPGRITSIKCGHHGDNACTSAALLQIAGPSVALISCGALNPLRRPYPSQEAIDRLLAEKSVENVYLTNYRITSPKTPPEYKFVVSGSNGRAVNGSPVHGDVVLVIDESSPSALGAYYRDADNKVRLGDFTLV